MVKTLKDVELEGKTVIVRVDFNIPLDSDIKKSRRMTGTLPTIKYLLEKSCKVVLISHLGRPKGRVVESMRMGAIASALGELLEKEVLKLDDCVGERVSKKVSEQPKGSVILLENLRFHPEEEANDENFARELASLGDVYVNDAFGACHRNHASVSAISGLLPSCAGFLLEKEVTVLKKILENPERPFIAVVGGNKISDKLAVLKNLVKKADFVLVGGAMAFTFLKAKGGCTGKSPVEEDFLEESLKIMESGKIILPVDIVEAKERAEGAGSRVVDAMKIDEGFFGFDIGRESLKLFERYIKKGKSVVWNGPVGLCEVRDFALGTGGIMKALAESEATTVIGGGNTLLAAEKSGLDDKISHLSTGGGAMLKFLEGSHLSGLEHLKD